MCLCRDILSQKKKIEYKLLILQYVTQENNFYVIFVILVYTRF